jgi:hypothetical protein
MLAAERGEPVLEDNDVILRGWYLRAPAVPRRAERALII